MKKRSLPEPDQPFPLFDRIVLHHICGGHKPLACTQNQWCLTHSENTLYQCSYSKNSGEVHTRKQYVTILPDSVSKNPEKFIMVYVPYASDDIAVLVTLGARPGYILDTQLRSRYGLTQADDYTVYHVQHPPQKLFWNNQTARKPC